MGEERGEKAEGSRRWLPERRNMDFAMDMGEWLLLKTAEQEREREKEMARMMHGSIIHV